MSSVLVVGGGALGLLSAWMLAREGVQVTLVERGEVGREASWAGGGIVSPLYPWRYGAAVTALAHWSQDFYPRLGASLLAETGIDPEVHVTGLYWLDLEDEVAALSWASRQGRSLTALPMSEVRAAVPGLGRGFTRALHMEGVANVRNPYLMRALHKALQQQPNLTMREHCFVQGFIHEHGRLRGVHTEAGALYAEHVVITAGAWSGELLAPLGLGLPIEPVKGQMILYKCADDFLQTMLLAKGRYAIPRRDGHVLVGSTLEHVGFNKTPTEEALASLQASAEELLPALAEAAVARHWAGLRPGSPDGIPFIGEVPECPGLWLNCGHYRNGLVLAPASCRLLVDLMLGNKSIIDPVPYAPAGRLMLA